MKKPVKDLGLRTLKDGDRIYYVVVCGGRDFSDRDYLFSCLDKQLRKMKRNGRIIIVHGGAKGADTLAGEYAKHNNYQCVVVPAKWKTDGRKAGPIRNQRMAEYATHVIAFDGGRGTNHMVSYSTKLGLPVKMFSKRKSLL